MRRLGEREGCSERALLLAHRSPDRRPAVLGWMVAAWLLLWPGLARAQDAPLSAGLSLPIASVAAVDNASALDTNPAGLIRLSGPELMLHHTDQLGLQGVTTTSGNAVWLGLPMGGSATLGMGYTHLPQRRIPMASSEETAATDRSVHRASLSLAGGSRSYAIGGALHNVKADDERSFESFTSVELGLVLSPWRWLSMGAVARDVNSPWVHLASEATLRISPVAAGAVDVELPSLRSVRIHPSYELGVAVRPFADWLTMEAHLQLHSSEDSAISSLSVGGHVSAEITKGVRLEVGADFDDAGGVKTALSVGFDLPHSGVSLGVFQDMSPENQLQPNGASVAMRFSAASYPSLLKPRPGLVELTLSGVIPERRRSTLLRPDRRPTLSDILLLLDRLRTDPSVGGLLLSMNRVSLGLAQAQEVRAALDALKDAKKKVLVHLISPDHRVYLAVSGADELRIHPGGAVMLLGLRAEFTYYARGLDGLGIEAEFIRVGKYKTAPNRFTRSDMAPAEREAEDALLDSLYGDLVSDIGRGRKRNPDQVKAWVNAGPYDAASAVEAGLIDKATHYDVWRSELEKERHRLITGYPTRREHDPRWGARPRVAVVHLDGIIVGGRDRDSPITGRRTTGDVTMERLLTRLTEDSSIRAVVLRVNSPGGSAIASESIYRYAAKLREKKPLIVSMGNVAASGGYYVAAAADYVFADAATITGSIGIFAGKFNLQRFWKQLSIHTETLRRGERADLLSSNRGFTPTEREALQRVLKRSYDQFIDRVAKGRKMETAAVEAVAQGRVWTGRDAKKQGLVDANGGLLDALAEARRRAKIPDDADVQVLTMPSSSSLNIALATVAESLELEQHTPSPLEREITRTLAPILDTSFSNGAPLLLMDPIVVVK